MRAFHFVSRVLLSSRSEQDSEVPTLRQTDKSTEILSDYPIRKIKQGNAMESDWGQCVLF